MTIQQIPQKIFNRLITYSYRALRIDPISHSKITPRSDLKSIGKDAGSWVIPSNLINSNSTCYCVGCGEDISFDLDLIKSFACEVHGFDPTPKSIVYVQKTAGDYSKYHFHEYGLWENEDTLKFYSPKNPNHVSHSLLNLQKTEDYILVKVKRLSAIMHDLGHDHLDLLKIDIEGAEYKVIQSIIEDKIDVKVLCVEYDEYFNPLDSLYKERITASVNQLLSNDYILVHSEGNGNYTFVKST